MKYSLFIGRFQPFHEGHKTLIETVLNEGKNVCIAIKNTKREPDNPFSVKDRTNRIKQAMRRWGNRVKIITVPDITEVCYGRKVGWSIRKIRLPKSIEAISATQIRKKLRGNRPS